jgi:hypothetical protein
MKQDVGQDVGQMEGPHSPSPIHGGAASDITPHLAVTLGTFNTGVLGASYATVKASAVGMCALDGDIVILPGAAPLMTVLRKGSVTVSTTDGQTLTFHVGSGIAQITPTSVRVVCDAISRVDEKSGDKKYHTQHGGTQTGAESTYPSPQPRVWGDDIEC